jgi:N-acylglucosamine-6-phosphate 2-epimerase
MRDMNVLDQIRGGVVISCQPLPDVPDDPMRDSYVQARVAASALMGGAIGVRVNGVDDIAAVRKLVPSAPIIGLIKAGTAPVFITPTIAHARAAAAAGADIVAVDATDRARPDGMRFADTVSDLHEHTGALVLADVSTLAEGIAAAAAGADAVATTLAGYTSAGTTDDQPDVRLVEELTARLEIPVVAEGRYRTPDDVDQALRHGAHAVVVGNAVTSPLWLTRRLTGARRAGPRHGPATRSGPGC